jgi:hypothetical protein
MIEVNRRLYMDEETGNRLPTFGSVQSVVSEMLIGVAHCTAGFRC